MNRKNIYNLCLLAVVITFLPLFARAQWNPNTAENILISTLKDADQQCVSTTDSKTWIAYYYQNSATSNYDMYAQLIDADGYKLLGENGVLVSNHTSGSATFVFNVCVDLDNNLIIGFQDQRVNPNSMTTVIYKISQTGQKLWGDDGIVLGSGYSPYPAVLSTNEVVVAWIDEITNTLLIQKISETGTPQWSTPVSVTVGSSGTTRGQLIGLLNGKFAMVYQEQNYAIYTTLYGQHFNNNGVAMYPPSHLCGETTHATRYYSICAEGDTVYFGYFSAMGQRFNSWLQRMNPDGTTPYGINGSNFSINTSPGNDNQMETHINMTPGKQHIWSVCTYSDAPQNLYGVYIQKFKKSTGERLLTNYGKVVYPVSTAMDQQQGQLALVDDDPMFMNYDGVYKIYATRLDSAGNFAWPVNRVEISSTQAMPTVPKGRFGFTPDGPDRCIGIWVENRGGGYRGYAQGISVGGLTGIDVFVKDSLPPFITQPGGTLQMDGVIYPTSSGQDLVWSILPGSGTASISTDGLVTAISNGTVWAKGAAAQDTTMFDTVMITISGQVTGIPSPEAARLIVSPVPNKGRFTVSLKGAEEGNFSLKVFDLTGRIVFSSFEFNANSALLIDITKCPQGLYLVEVSNGTTTCKKKVEVVR